jgi:hypothetical protein
VVTLLDSPGVTQRLQRGRGGRRDRRRLVMTEVPRSGCDLRSLRQRVLCERAFAAAEHLVAGHELADL